MIRNKGIAMIISLTLLFSLFLPTDVFAAGGISIYTPYTGISLTPGEKATYTVDINNDSNEIKNLDLRIENVPEGWEYSLTKGGYAIDRLAVKPGHSQSFTLDVEVPLKVEKGSYTFQVVTEDQHGTVTSHPVTISINEQGVFKTELTTDQPNMEGDAYSTFRYDLELYNRTAEEQHYSLRAEAPRGWNVDFRVDGKNVTSVTVESNQTEQIDVEITPSETVKKGKYEVPVMASSGSTKAQVTLEADITGTFEMELTTPSGRLSEDLSPGGEKVIELEVRNIGTSTLKDISLNSHTPPNWNVNFEPEEIDRLDPGKSKKVKATLTASDKAIAGDYVVEMSARSPEVSSEKTFRISVKTSMLWG
ncbi:MAG: hypothetical protein H0Z32_06995 [Bacillaceae bacterium]|nr:hypothetical protein [Bacillaceae bacterium]